MSESALLELADRVAKASGPDRELDVLIRAELDGRDVRWDGNLLLGRYRRPPHDECRLGSIDPGKLARNFSVAWSSPECPHYTSSLDAAMTLVPEGGSWVLNVFDVSTKPRITKSHAHVSSLKVDGAYSAGCLADAATPALALTAACLRARANQEKTDAR